MRGMRTRVSLILLLLARIVSVAHAAPGDHDAPVLAAPGAPPARGGSAQQQPVPDTGGPLTLERAIALAIEHNAATRVAGAREEVARGLRREALADLLPDVSASASQANRTVNLAALGFMIPGMPPLIGPFNSFDARVELAQSIFDLSALRSVKAGTAGVEAARYGEDLAREQVAAATALEYVDTLKWQEAVAAARADLELAKILLEVAEDQHDAGVATGLDVTRAETRVAQTTYVLSGAETELERARLRLERLTGLPLGASLELADTMRETFDPLPDAPAAVATALGDRFEVKIADATLRQRSYERGAAEAELYPSVEVAGDYGSSGSTPTETALPTRQVEVRVNVPIFNGGATRGRIATATGREHEAEIRYEDVRAQVEEDVRLALASLRTSAEQVTAARQAFKLAERQVQFARDRFTAGVTDNIEVADAQRELESARINVVAALAAYNMARANLAAALGRAQAFRL